MQTVVVPKWCSGNKQNEEGLSRNYFGLTLSGHIWTDYHDRPYYNALKGQSDFFAVEVCVFCLFIFIPVFRASFIFVWSFFHSQFISVSFWDGQIFIAVAGWGGVVERKRTSTIFAIPSAALSPIARPSCQLILCLCFDAGAGVGAGSHAAGSDSTIIASGAGSASGRKQEPRRCTVTVNRVVLSGHEWIQRDVLENRQPQDRWRRMSPPHQGQHTSAVKLLCGSGYYPPAQGRFCQQNPEGDMEKKLELGPKTDAHKYEASGSQNRTDRLGVEIEEALPYLRTNSRRPYLSSTGCIERLRMGLIFEETRQFGWKLLGLPSIHASRTRTEKVSSVGGKGELAVHWWVVMNQSTGLDSLFERLEADSVPARTYRNQGINSVDYYGITYFVSLS
ncbi:hypothetical protein DFH09DRAFT_1099156 [Mycena vulgaris]|nr:hypothetical protein DFH09DRAFT_1099156 [Mycena vulgaris]